MLPTPYAESLEEPLREALDRIERTLSGVAFDPFRSTRLFRLLGSDHLSELLLPKLTTLLAQQAPGIRFQMLPENPRSIALQLAEGSIDLAFARTYEAFPDWVDHVVAMHESPTVVASKSNRELARAGVKDRGTIPIDLFCEMPHVFFSPVGNLTGDEDDALAKIGRNRRIVLTVPDFFSVGRIVAQTELLGLIPAKFALSIADQLGLRIYSLPFDMPLVALGLSWHKRHTSDAEHRWMRERILGLLEALDVVRHPVTFAAGKDRIHRSPRKRSKGSRQGHRGH